MAEFVCGGLPSAPSLQAFVDDLALGVMLGSEQDPSVETLGGRLERSPVRAAEGRGVDFVIADVESDDLLGAVNMFALDWHSYRGEVGTWLRRQARGRGRRRPPWACFWNGRLRRLSWSGSR